jgi:hypothetical protein
MPIQTAQVAPCKNGAQEGEIGVILAMKPIIICRVSQKNVPYHILWYYFAIFNQRFNFFAVG